MKTVQETHYETADGRRFSDFDEAYEHDQKIASLVFFSVKIGPDLNEGRHGPSREVIIGVNTKDKQEAFALHACYQLFGSPYTFVQGIFGSNAITPSWVGPTRLEETPDLESVFAVVEERFAENTIWGEGVTRLQE